MDFDTVAAAWSRWWPTFERGAGAVSARIIELAEVEPGDRVLDVGTGLGEPALAAARRAGPSGAVIAIDRSPAMLALGRERARREGIDNVVFVEADFESYDGGAPFDAMVSRWGIMFSADVQAALVRLRAQLAPGARFAAATWGLPREVPVISLTIAAAARLFETPMPPLEGSPFALHDGAELARMFSAAGFENVLLEDLTVVFPFDSAAQYYAHVTEVAPPIQGLLARLDDERRSALRDAVERTVIERFTHDGAIRMPNRALIASGSNPSARAKGATVP
ncbi:MAG: class I SAM-dependent methyltransferase [Vulcanimicrobiaceae bacterium]